VYGWIAVRSAFDCSSRASPVMRAFRFGRGRQAAERRPHRVLDRGRDRDLLGREQRRDPFGRPDCARTGSSIRRSGWNASVSGIAALPERMMRAAHREHGGARGEALVEDIDL
jgi:hypothetical protein